MTTFIDGLIGQKYTEIPQYTPKDFKTDIDVRWCAGCGGYSILNQVQRIMPDLGIPKEKITFISGIGCSSRFPYYMDLYGLQASALSILIINSAYFILSYLGHY